MVLDRAWEEYCQSWKISLNIVKLLQHESRSRLPYHVGIGGYYSLDITRIESRRDLFGAFYHLQRLVSNSAYRVLRGFQVWTKLAWIQRSKFIDRAFPDMLGRTLKSSWTTTQPNIFGFLESCCFWTPTERTHMYLPTTETSLVSLAHMIAPRVSS